MKKILMSLASITLLFASCEKPMDAIDQELDSIAKAAAEKAEFLRTRPSAPAAYTLTDKDYALSSDADVSKYKNFSAAKPVKDFLPEILNKKFSGSEGQAMAVTYNYYSKVTPDTTKATVLAKQDFSDPNAIKFTFNAYQFMGRAYNNFDNDDQAAFLIGKYLDNTVVDLKSEVTVQYILYKKTGVRKVSVSASGFAKEVAFSTPADIVVDNAMYTSLGQKYGNFNDIYQAGNLLRKYMTNNSITTTTVFQCVIYSDFKYGVFIHNGSNFVLKKSVMPVTEELNYFLDKSDITKSYWWADPAIKILLSTADYQVWPGNGDSAAPGGTAAYGNFDIRSGKNPGTNEAYLVEMIGKILDTNYTSMVADGQQFLVSYAYYNGSNGIASIRVVKNGGTWSKFVVSN